MFERLLGEQVAEIRRLRTEHPDHDVVWAGDFNQTLIGSNRGGSNRSRGGSKLHSMSSTSSCGTETSSTPSRGSAIDLICGPRSRAPSVERIDPVVDGRVLSDHAGYVVEI